MSDTELLLAVDQHSHSCSWGERNNTEGEKMRNSCIEEEWATGVSSNSHVSAGQSWQWSHMEAAVSLGETAGEHTHTHLCSLPKPTELSSILKLFPETKAVPYRYKAAHYIFWTDGHTPGMHNNSVPYIFFPLIILSLFLHFKLHFPSSNGPLKYFL